MSAKDPDAADAVIGRNIRIRRLAKRMSQTELGRRLGITFQQVQKYESGSNRVACGRLVRIAVALDVPLLALFEGVEGLDRRRAGRSPAALIAREQPFRLALAFAQIENAPVRRALVALVALAEQVARRPRRVPGTAKA